MKTERRHELQRNDLAQSITTWAEAVQPYSRAILAGVIALVMAFVAWGYLSSQNSRQTAAGWNEYFQAMDNPNPTEMLRDVADRYAGAEVSQWARLSLGDIELGSGTNRLFVDKAAARQNLRDAKERFQALLLESSNPTILQRATLGLARTHETLGELDEARKQYQALIDKWPDSPLKITAEARQKDLERNSTKGFYDWFAKYEPPKPLGREPGTPGAKPDFLKEPTAGGLTLPSAIDDKTPVPATPDAGGTPAAETPAAEAPATEAPAAEAPAAEAPAETPAAEAPAAEAPAEKPAEPAPAEPAPQP